MGLVFPLVVRRLLDAAFLAANGARLNRVGFGLLILFAFQAVINFGQSYLMASVSERVIADLRKDLFGHLALQPPGFFSMRRVGELSSRIAADAALIQQVLRFGVPELLRQGLFLIGALTLITLTNPRLTLVTLTAIPFAILVGWILGRRVRRISTSIQDRLAAAVSRAEQVFTQIRVVQSFTREAWEAERFAAEIDETRDLGLQRGVARAALTGAVTFTGVRGRRAGALGGRSPRARGRAHTRYAGSLPPLCGHHLGRHHFVGRLLEPVPGIGGSRAAHL